MLLLIVLPAMETEWALRYVLDAWVFLSLLNYFNTHAEYFVVIQRAVPVKSSRQESLMSVQDISIQSQALISIKDSNKVSLQSYNQSELYFLSSSALIVWI